jgi:hypothetical protein
VSCKKDEVFIPDNEPIGGSYISTLQLENYVNRVFIDLIGREPLDAEMEVEVSLLKEKEISLEARRTLIEKLQQDETEVPGDSTYKRAYYYRFYEVAKVKMIEGVENDFLLEDRVNIVNNLNAAVISGDSASAAFYRDQIKEIDAVFAIPNHYMKDSIDIEQVFYRLIDNYVYDIINMNTFNFVNATFQDLYFRYPTAQEFDVANDMIENNIAGSLVGLSGSNRGDYMTIMTSSSQFYEGMIIWAYMSLLIRNPTAQELQSHLQGFPINKDFQELQVQIMITDEYANF